LIITIGCLSLPCPIKRPAAAANSSAIAISVLCKIFPYISFSPLRSIKLGIFELAKAKLVTPDL
jgi:hypothetical protein